ncbi:TPR-like protein [Thozetella sp. PMI_491]|nr:TPR-like protein [Thozetella sp. PMI_491]
MDQFQGDSSRTSHLSSDGAISTQFEPDLVLDSDETIERKALVIRWEEAMKKLRAEGRLRSHEPELSNLKEAEQLRSALNMMARETPDPNFERFVTQLQRYITAAKDLTSALLIHMKPFRVEADLLWGAIYLAVKFAKKRHALKGVNDMQFRVTTLLHNFEQYRDVIDSDRMIREKLVGVIIAMTRLWVTMVKYVRVGACGADADRASETSKQSDSELEDVIADIKSAVGDVKEIANIDIARRRIKHDNMAAHLPEYDSPFSRYYQQVLPVTQFTGREEELKSIWDHFDPKRPSAWDLRIVVVHGLGGMGKKWLLVADNLDNAAVLLQHLPFTKGNIIITTRYTSITANHVGDTFRLELNSLTPEESSDLFWKLCSRMNFDSQNNHAVSESLRGILERFGGHPLTIELFSAYIVSRNASVSELMDRLPAMMRRIRITDGGQDSKQKLATLWEAQFAQTKGTAASSLLGIMSLMSPDVIPERTFNSRANNDVLTLVDCTSHAEDIEDSLEHLIDLGLIKRYSGEGRMNGSIANERLFSIHRMVADAYLHSESGLNRNFQPSFAAACSLVLALYPIAPNSISHYGKFDQAQVALPHAVSLANHYATARQTPGHLFPTPDFLRLLHHTTWFLWELGDYERSLKYLKVAKSAADNSTRYYAGFCLTEGTIWHDRNNLTKCSDSFGEVERVLQKVPDDPGSLHWCDFYTNKALLEYSSREYNKAIDYFERALKVVRSVYSDHFEEARASIFLNLAHSRLRLLYDHGNLELKRGNFDKADELYEQAFAIRQNSCSTHVRIAAIHYKRGIVRMGKGDFEAALTYFDKGLAIANFQSSDGEIARISRKKAMALKALEGQVKQGEELASWALEIGLQAAREQGQQLERIADTDEAFDNLICGYFR